MSKKIIRPEIKGYHYQLPEDDKIYFDEKAIAHWKPKDPNKVELWIVLRLGEKGKRGMEEFTVHIITSNVVTQAENKNPIMIIPRYDGWDSIKEKINQVIFNFPDDSWESFCRRMSEHFSWEFDFDQ